MKVLGKKIQENLDLNSHTGSETTYAPSAAKGWDVKETGINVRSAAITEHAKEMIP